MKNNSTDPNETNHKDMNRDDRRFWAIIVVFIIIGVIIFFGIHRPANAPSSTDMTAVTASTSASTEVSATSTQTYSYSCDNDKSITVTFHLPQDDFTNVNLSDGRHLILGHVISADGARYANANESIVFWTKGVTAFVQEASTTTYSGCVANRFP